MNGPPPGPRPDLTGPNPSEGAATLDGGPSPEDRYRRGALLGVGGMGRVYAALDERLGREVALKEVKPGAGAGAAERLAREVRVTALLEHPGIVPVYDAGPGHGYYTMRLVRGRSLADALRSAPGREARLSLLRRVLGACEALAYAHSVGVVHRDVKPDNVMIGEFGQTLVVDWGLARVIPGSRVATAASLGGVSDAGLTQAGAVLGTPRYMSPEQAAGATATPAADVWSLGAILYELVAGAPPYAGEDAYDVLRRARAAEPTPLATVAPDAPAELAAIVNRALARDPEDRYPTAGALADDLTRYLDGHRVAAHDYTGAELAGRFARRWRVALGLGVLALLAVVATAGVGWWRTSSALERAIDAEAGARAALARGDAWLSDALVQQALVAEGRDAVPEAEVLAANALVLGGSPVARGILAGLAVAERPERVGPVATPDGCDDVLLTPDAAVALCRVGPTLSAWSTDPLARRWALELDVREIVPFSSDRAVAWLDGDALALVDLDTGAQIATFGPFLMGHGVGASADGAYLTFGAPGLFQVLDVAAGQTVPGPWQAGSVASSSFADHRIVVMMRDGRLLDGPVGGPIQAFETSFSGRSEARTVRHLPGGGWLVGTVSGQVARLDAGGKTVAQVDGFAGAVLGASVLPDGRTVVVHGGQGAPRIFDLATSAWRGRFPSGEGQRATVGRDGTVVIGPDPAWRWRVPSEVAPRAVSVGDGVTSLDVSPDGRWLAAAAGAGRALVWDLAAADPARDLWVNPKGAVIKDVVFAADGTLFTADAEGGLGAVGLPRPRGGRPRTVGSGCSETATGPWCGPSGMAFRAQSCGT